jgi:hypothetical protein
MLALASFAFSPNASPTCDPDGDHGCLNGAPYDRAKQFPCGSSGGFMDAGIFDYDSTGCCGEGLTYDPAEGYCCGGKTYSYNSGKCNVPGTNVPAECYCDPEAQAKFDARVKGPPPDPNLRFCCPDNLFFASTPACRPPRAGARLADRHDLAARDGRAVQLEGIA